MIGIITKENMNILLIEIASKKNTDVYWYKDNNLEVGIEKLKEKNCNIIITDQDCSKVNNTDIKFISLNKEFNDNDYLLDNNDLIDAVNNVDEEKINEILNNINIPKDKNIVINNQSLILIKHIIEEKLSNKVKTINDIILNEIPESNEEGQIYLIN